MSNRIKLLDNNLINKIAAGEVIDRPASILKELIENSIDAQARSIDIHIHKDQIDRFHVTDNGIGISREDLRIAFDRHATSKINVSDDLNKIDSFGFRGEALSSIAAVSDIKLSTSESSSEGDRIHIRYGSEISVEPSSHPKGTSISIENIFNNVPARKKFLKTNRIEHTHNIAIVNRYLLAHPEITFRVYINNTLHDTYEPSDLVTRISKVYKMADTDNLVPVELSNDKCQISGYVGDFDFISPSSSKQHIFVNKRYVRDIGINKIIRSCYSDGLRPIHHPFYILFIDVPADKIDVNIHPTKQEVKFESYTDIKFHMRETITQALSVTLSRLPGRIEYPKSNSFVRYQDMFESKVNSDIDTQLDTDLNNNIDEDKFSKFVSHIKRELIEDNEIWQLHNKYLVTEIKTGLLVIDQHVAHERILYEKTIDAIDGEGLPSQALLFPKTISLSDKEFSVLEDILFYLEKIGFSIRKFGDSEIIVDGAPSELRWGNEETIIKELLALKIKSKEVRSSVIDYVAASYSCHSAIKAGDPLEKFEMKNLIDKLFSTRQPYYCPHGRPIILNLSVDELDKKFERV